MGFTDMLKKAASIAVDFEDAPAAAKPPVIEVPGATVTTVTSVGQPTATADSEMLASLNKVITDRPTAYTNMLTVAAKLATVISDERQRMQSAAVASNVTGEQLAQAVTIHINDLDGAAGQFAIAQRGQVASRVDSQVADADRIASEIKSAQDKITELQAQIASLTASIADSTAREAKLRTDAKAALDEITHTATVFKATVDQLKASLTAHVQQLGALLK